MATHENLGRRAYTPAEVAALYGVHRLTVYGWLNSGELAGMRLSTGSKAQWRISPAALDDFEATHIRSRCSSATDDSAAAGS